MPAEKRARLFLEINHQPQAWLPAFGLAAARGWWHLALADGKERARV